MLDTPLRHWRIVSDAVQQDAEFRRRLAQISQVGARVYARRRELRWNNKSAWETAGGDLATLWGVMHYGVGVAVDAGVLYLFGESLLSGTLTAEKVAWLGVWGVVDTLYSTVLGHYFTRYGLQKRLEVLERDRLIGLAAARTGGATLDPDEENSLQAYRATLKSGDAAKFDELVAREVGKVNGRSHPY